MTNYGIIDYNPDIFNDEKTWSVGWRMPKNNKIYQTKINSKILESIHKYGFETVRKYLSENSSKQLVDREKEDITLISFPYKSGGHFFGNCLSLSDKVFIPSYPTIEDKCNFLCSSYDSEKKYWNDVNISHESLSKSFILSHIEEDRNVKTLWNFWSNSNSVILFKNISLFVGLRKCVASWKSSNGYYDVDENGNQILLHKVLKLSESDVVNLQWKGSARNTRETNLHNILNESKINIVNYHKLSPKVRNNLKTIFNDKNSNSPQVYSYCKLSTKKQVYFWDVNWYLDEQEFLSNMKSFYVALDLGDFDEESTKKCYRSWMKALYRCAYNILKEHK